MTSTDMLPSGRGAASVIGLMTPSSIATVTVGRSAAGPGSASPGVEYAICSAQDLAFRSQHRRISPQDAGPTGLPSREVTCGSASTIRSRPRPSDRASRPFGVTRHPKPALSDNGRYCFSRHGALAFKPCARFAREVATASHTSYATACAVCAWNGLWSEGSEVTNRRTSSLPGWAPSVH
jgi:hypothetical protein